MRLTKDALDQVRKALSDYHAEVESTTMTDSTKNTYVLHAEHFVRWLAGDFQPGCRKDPQT